MSGYVLWEGNSIINKKPIAAILTLSSANRKTGDIPQVWIIPEDCPTTARREETDVSIGCGLCEIKDNCYVTLYYGPNNIWKTYHKGKYLKASIDEIKTILNNRPVRWGAYGDPAVLPVTLIQELSENRMYKGYTHLWNKLYDLISEKEIDIIKQHFVASVETEECALVAWAKGWRTFRIRKSVNDPLLPGEIVCPASNEFNHMLQCYQCNFCCGTKGTRNICIVDHGPRTRGKKK